MNLNTVPTKGNLMSAKSSLALARQGYELMEIFWSVKLWI